MIVYVNGEDKDVSAADYNIKGRILTSSVGNNITKS